MFIAFIFIIYRNMRCAGCFAAIYTVVFDYSDLWSALILQSILRGGNRKQESKSWDLSASNKAMKAI